MADPLLWAPGEGYDIHVLRGKMPGTNGPASKRLDKALGTIAGSTLTFIPQSLNSPNNFGVDVDQTTGVVTAKGHLNAAPKFPNLSFLLTAHEATSSGATNETIIRIHVHDGIQKIWLTPAALTIHQAHPESRFTVLALFDDGAVGDITEWPQLRYQSNKPTVVKVLNTGQTGPDGKPVPFGGLLESQVAGQSADITVTLTLTSPAITKTSPSAPVSTLESWRTVAAAAIVEFVAGPVTPNLKDPLGTKPDSVRTVVETSRNLLFVAEGFTNKNDFTQAVQLIVAQLRSQLFLEPFQVLANSITYWSLFIPSTVEGIGILGSQSLSAGGANQTAAPVPLPRRPGTGPLNLQNMIHVGGLPLAATPALTTDAAWGADRSVLYANISLPVQLEPNALAEWSGLKSRTLLNERNTVFGLAHYDRDRASGQDRDEDPVLVDPRRTKGKSVSDFLERLECGADPEDPSAGGFEIGKTWVETAAGDVGKDVGLVCFVCRSGTRGGGWTLAGPAGLAYFAAATGVSDKAEVATAVSGNGLDISTPPVASSFSAPLVASVVAHEWAHILGLGDECGDVTRSGAGVPNTLFNQNLARTRDVITTNPQPPNTVDPLRIKWRWPRLSTAALLRQNTTVTSTLTVAPEPCTQSGTPTPNGTFLLIRLRRDPPTGHPFVKTAAVRVRTWPVLDSTSQDPIATAQLIVETVLADAVVVGGLSPADLQTITTNFDPKGQFALVSLKPQSGGGILQLVPDLVQQELTARGAPLNAPTGAPACVPAANPIAAVPLLLPTTVQLPRRALAAPADIVGIFEGGGGLDCGILRPAGRCQMRSRFNRTTPFCRVCRYVIVERLDPRAHGELEALFSRP
jgi:hypothetical protein